MREEEPNPISQQQQHEEGGDQEQAAAEEAVACDYCGESKAVVYCRADTARLCLVCDRHVHSANSVSSKHSRSLLCDSCASAPASILFCASTSSCRSSLLCSNCDFEANNNININSEINGVRRPVEPFSGCPTALDLVSILGVGGEAEKEAMIKKKKKTKGEEDADDLLLFDRLIEEEVGMWVWETPQVVRLDDLIVPAAAASPATSVAILPLPKPKSQNVTCGKQKEEILQQLHTLLKSETEFIDDHEEAHPIADFQLILSNNSDQDSFPVLNIDASSTFRPSINEEVRSLEWDNNCWNAYPATFPCEGQQQSSLTIPSLYLNDFEEIQTSECVATVSDAELGHHIIRENISQDTPKSGAEYLCPDRGSLLSRYKEKRKTRRYDKLIRYESRKARADSRVRIKGRFAKGNQVPNP